MAFQQPGDFTHPDQTQFATQLSQAPGVPERKGSVRSSSNAFHNSQQDWHDVPLDSKPVDENMHDIALGPGQSMNSSHFKNEPSWSPHEPATSFSQPSDFDPLIPEYSVHRGTTSIGLSYDPSTQPSHNGSSPSAAPNSLANIPSTSQFPLSPSQPWIQTPVSDGFDFSPLAPQRPRQTPVFATSTSILRRDGIRKKNARFEIPAERNLRTIDQLIAQTSDETEIKELKQQKRLLRNRQAALDSRQRKKQHTERLEEEKKQYTNLITEMDEELSSLKLREAEWMRQRDELLQNANRLHQWCQQLQAEKEETLRAHTVESGQLRKENAMLLEQLQRVDAASMSAPGSAGLPTEFSDFEQLTIQNSPWESFPIQSNFSVEAGSDNEANVSKSGSIERKTDKTPASGLVLMLLLCGAWVISRQSTNESSLLPSIPEDLRVASATVIQDLYRDSGITLPENDIDAAAAAATKGSNSDHLTHDLCGDPLSGQMLQSFSMEGIHTHSSPMQVQRDAFDRNGISSSDGANNDQSQVNQIIRDAIRSTRNENGQEDNAQAYPRSLLIDKVPNQILRDFAQMVSRGSTRNKVTTFLQEDQSTFD